ncbi:MAG TPA: hypothetical protein VIW45_12915 [Vicinamibacterales bacterium]
MAAVGVIAYAVSWFLPAVKGGGDPSVARLDPVLGWQAFVISIAALREIRPFASDALFWGFAALSALTNGVFVAAAALHWACRPAQRRRWLEIALWTCGAVNLIWIPIAGTNLRVGYYLWGGSFLALATVPRLSRVLHTSARTL